MKILQSSAKISVALCTFEGSLFLNDQLKSLSEQTFLPVELVVCDDASTDGTLELLKQYAGEGPFPVRASVNSKRLGAVQNFSRVLGRCDGEYMALCDQDDIWEKDKLELTLQAMLEAEEQWGPNTPILVHSDLRVINSEGDTISPSFMKMRKIKHIEERALNSLLVQNFVTGCTVLVNRALIERALPIPAEVVMHDWWLALMAAAEGQIIYIDQTLVNYRRHEDNVIGARGFISWENISRILQFNQIKKEMAVAITQAICLRDRLQLINPDEDVTGLLNDYIKNLQKGGFSAARAVFRHKIFKQGLLRNVVYLLLLLGGSCRKALYF